MKRKILFVICTCMYFNCSYAFSDSTISPKDFKSLTGCWKGSITYLDYSSNKPFSMPAELVVKEFKNNSTFIPCMLLYPQEPKANTPDTIYITNGGRYLNDELIKRKQSYRNDSLEIVTEIQGIDGNDHKPALIRHTYNIGRKSYSLKKEVLFTGQAQWILRNKYQFSRVKNCN